MAVPSTIPSQSTLSIGFEAPNELDAPMTGLRVTVPAGLEIAHAHDITGWTATFDESSASWSGGELAPGAVASFGVTLKAVADLGTLTATADQRYANRPDASWPVTITVLPPEKSPSENFAVAAVVGLIGLLLVVSIVMLAWRRRRPGSPTP